MGVDPRCEPDVIKDVLMNFTVPSYGLESVNLWMDYETRIWYNY